MSNIQMEALDFKYLVLEYYKRLHISEEELAVILVIDHLLSQKNTFITPDLLSLRMNLSVEQLDKIVVDLIQKDYLLYDITSKKTKISLKPLHKKLYEVFKNDLAVEQANKVSEEKEQAIQNIYQVFEKEFNRPLSPLEFSLIGEWIAAGYTDERIINALKQCIQSGRKSLKSVDRLLIQWQTRDDIEKTGYSAMNQSSDKSMEELIEIAKVKWLDED